MSAKSKYYMHLGISLLFMFCFGFLPAIDPITPYGMRILGIFIGTLYGWIATGNLIWPSIFCWLALGTTTSFSTVPQILASLFSNSTLILIMAMLMFASAINTSGLGVNISHAMISSKALHGRPWALSITIFVATFVSAMFISVIAAFIICFEFVYSISKQVGYKPRDTWPAMMLSGVIFAGCLGQSVLPYKPGVTACYGMLMAANPGMSFQFNEYFVFALLFSILAMILFILICKFVIRPDMSKFTDSDYKLEDVPPMDAKKKFTAFLTILLVGLLLIPSFLPSDWAFVQFLNGIGTAGLAFFVVAIAVLVKDKDGNNYLEMKEISKGVSWDLILMIGTALTIGPALSGAETGVRTVFVNLLMPLANGDGGAYIFTVVLLLITLVGTNFINNAVMNAILVPVLATVWMTVGVNPVGVVALISLLSGIAMLFPSASPAGAILSGAKDWISQKQITTYSIIAMISGFAITLFAIPIAEMMFTM